MPGMPRTRLGFLMLLAVGCASAPVRGPSAAPAVELTSSEVVVAEQDFEHLQLRFDGSLTGTPGAKVTAARYELVADGKVVRAAEAKLDVVLGQGATDFSFPAEGAPPKGEAPELVALRGELVVVNDGQLGSVAFARSLEVRPPKPLTVRLKDHDAGRYSPEEANVVFYVGVDNPNGFLVRLGALDYKVAIAGKQLSEGTVGESDAIAPSSTGVYEVQVELKRDTFGPDVGKLIRANKAPYRIEGTLRLGQVEQPFAIAGEIKLGGGR